MTACQSCESSKQLRASGVYQFRCLTCRARLVLSVSPDKNKAKAMLAAIARFPEAPAREDILECVCQKQGRQV